MKTKYFFLLGILSLFLLNSCSKDEELEQLDENSEVTTRALSGSIDMSITGSTVSISWNQPFGEGVGITVTVFDNTGATYGGFSSEEDSGSDFFGLSLPDLYPTGSLVALVRDLPESGISTEFEYVGITNNNSGSGTNPNPQYCDHDYSVGNNITVAFDDNFSKCTINHALFNPGKLMMLLSVGTRTFEEEWDGADFDGDSCKYSIYIPDGTRNPTIANHITTINVSQFQKYLSEQGVAQESSENISRQAVRTMKKRLLQAFQISRLLALSKKTGTLLNRRVPMEKWSANSFTSSQLEECYEQLSESLAVQEMIGNAGEESSGEKMKKCIQDGLLSECGSPAEITLTITVETVTTDGGTITVTAK